MKVLAERGEDLPEGSAIAADGGPTRDPRDVLTGAAALLPFGGFKGYGLAVFAEILGGIVGGDGVSGAGVNAMLSIYIDVGQATAEDGYRERLGAFVQSLRETPEAAGSGGVAIPGDRGARRRAEARALGVPVTSTLCASLVAAADRVAVPAEVRAGWPSLMRG